MRRIGLVLALLALMVGTAGGPGSPPLGAAVVDCQDYCAEKAAERCDRVGSLTCDFYILGCLGGCHLRRF